MNKFDRTKPPGSKRTRRQSFVLTPDEWHDMARGAEAVFGTATFTLSDYIRLAIAEKNERVLQDAEKEPTHASD